MSCPINANMSARVRNKAPRLYRRYNQLASRALAQFAPGHPVLDLVLRLQARARVLVKYHGGVGLSELAAS